MLTKIYPAEQAETDGMVPIGKIIKKPKNVCAEIFTEANTFDVRFPQNATGTQKAIIAGSAVFLSKFMFTTSTRDSISFSFAHVSCCLH